MWRLILLLLLLSTVACDSPPATQADRPQQIEVLWFSGANPFVTMIKIVDTGECFISWNYGIAKAVCTNPTE